MVRMVSLPSVGWMSEPLTAAALVAEQVIAPRAGVDGGVSDDLRCHGSRRDGRPG